MTAAARRGPRLQTARSLGARLLIVSAWLGATWVAGACANASAPPGGPPDLVPPFLVAVSPENGDTSVAAKSVTLQFDEVISESPKGSSELADLVFISPRSGDVRVSWKRSRLEIQPSEGFRDSAVYTVILRPGIQDLRNNSIDSASTFVFSTAGPIPNTTVSGVVFDWPAGRGARAALIEATSVVDTTTTYIGVADSVGRFALKYVPPGQYIVRSFLDRNANRTLERTELWDTVRIPLLDSVDVELYAFIHDTTPARITAIAVQDSGRRMRLTFDKPLSLDQLFTPPQFTLRSLPDSNPMAQRVVQVRTAQQQIALDSTERARKADSVRAEAAARDTIPPDSAALAREDSLARVRRRDSLLTIERARQDARRQLRLTGGPPPEVDSTPPPEMSREKPTTQLLIVFDSPVPSEARVVVEAKDMLTLTGVLSTARRPFLVPKRDTAPPPVDSAPPADSAAVATPPVDTTAAAAVPPDTTLQRQRRRR